MITPNYTNAAACSSVEPLEWFAIRVKSNREQVVGTSLSDKGYETLLPQYKEWPAFEKATPKLRLLCPGYVFCRFDVLKRLPVLTVPGVVHVVGIGKTPSSIPDQEIDSLRLVMKSELPVTPLPHFAVGENVRIDDGPLAGAVGIVVDWKRGLFVVSISLLQRSVSVNLPVNWLTLSTDKPVPVLAGHMSGSELAAPRARSAGR